MITIDEPGILTQAPDFENPLGLIQACHERILFHCDLLDKLTDYIARNEIDKEASDAGRRIHRYFNTAGKLHHQDEEKDLFPRLVRVSLKLADIINQLKQGHQQLDRLWESIVPSLSNLYKLDKNTLAQFSEQCHEFSALNRQHLEFEEEELLSIARHLISSDDMLLIGKSMRERRGL